MRRLRLILLIFIAIIWFIIILPYFLLQTQWGAKYASQALSNYVGRQVSIGLISHTFAQPYEITLEDVAITQQDQTIATLEAKKLIIGLNRQKLLQLNQFDYLLLENGQVILSDLPPAMISANLLTFNHMTLSFYDVTNDIKFSAYDVNGGIQYQADQIITDYSHNKFRLTAQKLVVNSIDIESLFIKGSSEDNTVNFTEIGGNIGKGYFTGNITANIAHSLTIHHLKINALNIQTLANGLNIEPLLSIFPQLYLEQLSVTNSNLNSTQFNIENGNIEVEHVTYNNGWQLQQSNLIFNAQSILWQDELLIEPLVKWQHEDDKIVLSQAMIKWSKGQIQTHGYLQHNHLVLSHMIAGGIEYQLPENWYSSLLNLQLPNPIERLTINQVVLLPSMVINTTPDFSFELEPIDGVGNNIDIIKQGNTLNFNGEIQLSAERGTLNTITLKRADMALSLSPTMSTITFSAAINDGIIDGLAKIRSGSDQVDLTLNSYFVDTNILQKWNLIKTPPKNQRFSALLIGSIYPSNWNGELIISDKSYAIKDSNILID